MKWFAKSYMGVILFILYVPIAVLILFSFNSGESTSVFEGLSLQWYKNLFLEKPELLEALLNSLLLALASAAVATVIGTLVAVGLSKMRSRAAKNAIMSVTNIPMMNPEIVTSISLMLLFVFISNHIFKSADVQLGFGTLLISHVTFNLPYVILSVSPKIQQLDKFLPEAAQDLGCTPLSSFFKVELPAIVPGIVSGLVMAFTLSLDDFVISHFVSSPDFKTLPLYIYTQTAHEVKFSMYALCTLLIFAILLLLIAVNVAGSIGERRARKKAGTHGMGGK